MVESENRTQVGKDKVPLLRGVRWSPAPLGRVLPGSSVGVGPRLTAGRRVLCDPSPFPPSAASIPSSILSSVDLVRARWPPC